MGGNRIIFLRSPDETFSFGRRCAHFLRSDSIVALYGDLGAGKTTFIQGLASALGIDGPIQSPTFTYLQAYKGTLPLYHFDLYRMKDASDFFGMGFEEYFDRGGIAAIEWAERLGERLPDRAISLHFSHIGEERTVRFSSPIGSKLIDLLIAWD